MAPSCSRTARRIRWSSQFWLCARAALSVAAFADDTAPAAAPAAGTPAAAAPADAAPAKGKTTKAKKKMHKGHKKADDAAAKTN